MGFRRLAALAAILAACSYADTITFTHTGVGSGTIGTTTFTDAAFTITDTADTASQAPFLFGSSDHGYSIQDTSASISIGGVGTFDFITATQDYVSNTYQTVDFARASGSDLFDGPSNTVFTTYNLLSSIGPIGGTGDLLQWSLSPVNTSGGVLAFGAGSSDTRFTATVGAVPEPGSLTLLGTVLAGLIGLAYLRRQSA